MRIEEIANDILTELDDPEVSLLSIIAWIKGSVGKISLLAGESYTVEGDGYKPEITEQLSEIIKASFYSRYFNKKLKFSLSNSFGQILSLKDDSSQVSFVNANEINKNYLAQAKMWNDELNSIVAKYRQNHTNSITHSPCSLTSSINTDFYKL